MFRIGVVITVSLVLLGPASGLNAAGANRMREARRIHGRERGIGVTLVSQREGWIVRRVWPQSPAEAAGLQVGDIIIALGEQALPPGRFEIPCGGEPPKHEDVRAGVMAGRRGASTGVELVRSGRAMRLEVPLARLAHLRAQAQAAAAEDPTTEGQQIGCMSCEVYCPPTADAPSGVWTCVFEICPDGSQTRCDGVCLTS